MIGMVSSLIQQCEKASGFGSRPITMRPMSAFGWWQAADTNARRAFVAASLGWALDSFDFMLWALVVAALIPEFDLSKTTVGLLGSIALLGGAAGGLIFGVIADRYGR